jgi:hypothetical protein
LNVADISRQRPPELRRVGITFPTHTRVMDSAIRIYRDLGIALDIDGDTISIPVPRTAASWYLGALERFTGTPGFSCWDTP